MEPFTPVVGDELLRRFLSSPAHGAAGRARTACGRGLFAARMSNVYESTKRTPALPTACPARGRAADAASAPEFTPVCRLSFLLVWEISQCTGEGFHRIGVKNCTAGEEIRSPTWAESGAARPAHWRAACPGRSLEE